MTEPRQTIAVAIDAQDLPGTQHELGVTRRKEITAAGALGIANHTGILQLLVGGLPAVQLRLFEDKVGHAVIEVTDVTRHVVLGIVDVELYGLVPPRREPAPKRERRFGDTPYGD